MCVEYGVCEEEAVKPKMRFFQKNKVKNDGITQD